MNIILLGVIFTVLLFTMVSSDQAFADVSITTADNDLATPGCLDTKVGCYTPNMVTVAVGDVIIMTNVDVAGIHTFTAGTVDGFAATPSGKFDSGILNTGNSFVYVADTAGEIPYYCSLHVWMQGTIIVQEASAETYGNIGNVQWLEASYPASGTGVVRIIDPDMNLNPEAVDNFDVDVWSDSDAGGIDLTVTETNEATGIFEGTVFFTTTDESSGHRLRVSEGDTVTAKYEDNTLPAPYTPTDEFDIIDTSIIQGSNIWTFDQINGTKQNLQNSDGSIVFPTDIDVYFPTNSKIRERILELKQQGIDLSGQFHEEEVVRYDGDVMMLAKTTSVITTSYDEFVLIFGKDRQTQEPIQLHNGIENIIIDDDYLLEKINLSLAECSQTFKSYCKKNPEELKDLILNKIGTHTINEKLVLEKITTRSKGEYIDISNPFASVIPTTYETSNKNENSFLTIISGLEKIAQKHDLISSADAQLGQFQNPMPGIYNLSFLNGFTIGYGFERDWSYEYNLLDIIPIYAEMHIEAGLGIGLRIPIDVRMEIATEQASQTRNFVATYTVSTQDIDEARYIEMGLHPGQGFAGKEFNSYLGPQLDLLIQVLGETVYERNESLLPIAKLPGNDFVPPLDPRPTKITEYFLKCRFTNTCFNTPIASGGLFTGVQANMMGEKITMDIQQKKPTFANEKITFTRNGEQQKYNYEIPNLESTSSSQGLTTPYDITLENVRYHSILDFTPKVKLSVKINTWIFPLEFGTEWINLPTIRFDDILYGTHDDTDGAFNAMGVLVDDNIGKSCGANELSASGQCIPYSITGGTVINATLNTNDNSIMININATDDGILTINPSKTVQDGIFMILVDGEEWDDVEIVNNKVTVMFLAGSEQIEIIGTFVIPEFGTIAMMVLTVAITSIIFISAKSRINLIPRIS